MLLQVVGFLYVQYIYILHIQEGTQKTEFIYKKLCIYSYMFKLQSPSKYSPFDAIYLSRPFFHCWKQCLNSLILMPFSVSAIFCFTSSTSAKCLPLRTFCIQGNKQTKKVAQGKIRWIGRLGLETHAGFSQKLLNTQHSVGRCARKSPIMKWADVLKESS